MSIDVNFPFECEERDDRRTKFSASPLLFRPRPRDGRGIEDNKLIFLAFPYSAFEWTRQWPWVNFYLKIPVHNITVIDGGSPRHNFVVCPVQMNQYAETISTPSNVTLPPFPNVRQCPLCMKSQTYWQEYRKAKTKAGIANVSLEQFKSMMDRAPEIRQLRDLALSWGPSEKWFFQVFDYGKYIGETPMDEGEDAVRVQGYLGPKKLVTALLMKQKIGYKPWDLKTLVIYTRDNSRGARYCSYEIEIAATPPTLDDATLAYLSSPEYVDPSVAVLHMSVEEMRDYVENYREVEAFLENELENGHEGSGFESEYPPLEPEKSNLKPAVPPTPPPPSPRVAQPISPVSASPAPPSTPSPAPLRGKPAAPPRLDGTVEPPPPRLGGTVEPPPPPVGVSPATPSPTADVRRSRVSWRVPSKE